MKKWIFFAAAPLLLTSTAFAEFKGIDAGFGWWSNEEITGARVGLPWYMPEPWQLSPQYALTLYIEPSIAYWHTDTHQPDKNKTLWAAALSPVLELRADYFDHKDRYLFVELGAGGAYLSKTSFDDRDLGSHLQFEDRGGLGFQFNESFRAGYRMIHYSNAGFNDSNAGFTVQSAYVTWFW